MSVRAIVVVILALVCGASAATGVTRYRLRQGDAEVVVETVPVLVAVDKLARGRMVTEKDVALRQWPKELAPAGAIDKVIDAVERAVLTPLIAGEPVLSGKLAPKDAGRGLAALVPKGMRAYAIAVSRAASGVAGFILPGNKVDVLLGLRGNQNDENGGGSTRTLLQSVEILAVDQLLDPPADNKMTLKEMNSVTLLVTPEQAGLLDLGQSMGQLSLSLRNPDDETLTEGSLARLADVRSELEKAAAELAAKTAAPPPVEPPPPVVPEPPVNYSITTLRGAFQSTVHVQRAP